MSTYGNFAAAYDRRNRREQRLVHLQFVGDLPGTPAAELAVGDHLMWNGGAVYVITGLREASPKFIEITERDARKPDSQEYTRRLKKDRLVARLTERQLRRQGLAQCRNCDGRISTHRPSHMPDKGACWAHTDTGLHDCGPDYGDKVAEVLAK